MNQIEPHLLWIGHAGEGRDFRSIFDTGIKALVQLAAEEKPPQPPRELIVCHFPLLDGTGNSCDLLLLSIDTVAALLKRRIPTLVSCGAGMSRAPVIAAAALAVITRESAEECLKHVVACHPSDVSPGLWNEVAGVLRGMA